MAGNDPVKTDEEVVAEELDQLRLSAAESRIIVPEIPYSPPPERLVQRLPELGVWYASFHRSMQVWREQLNKELT